MGYGYFYNSYGYGNSFSSRENEQMLQNIRECKGDNLIIKEGLERFNFSLLKDSKNIHKITLPKSFKELTLIPFREEFNLNLKHIKEIFVPLTVKNIDFISEDNQSDYYWPHLTIEKRNPVYFQYEHGIYLKKYMSLIYVDDDFTGNFTLFMNTNHISKYAFNNKKITELTFPHSLSISDLFGYEYGNIYFTKCNDLKIVHFNETKQYINPTMFMSSNTYSSFLKIFPSLRPQNLTTEDKQRYIQFIVKGLSAKSVISKEKKAEWYSYFKDHLKTFYLKIVDNIQFSNLLLENNLLTLDAIVDLVSLLELKPNAYNKNLIKQLTDYQNAHFSESDLKKHEQKLERQKIRNKEIEKAREEGRKKQEEINAIRKQWKCSRKGSSEWYIAGYKGNDEDIEIPEELSGRKVTGIDPYAFSPAADGLSEEQIKVRKNIKSISMPDTITTICVDAFYGCTNLSKIKLSSSLKLGHLFFTGSIFSGCKNLKEITIPEGITELYQCALSDNDYLEKINLPSTLEIIHEYVFSDCKRLKEIIIPEGLKIIKGAAFKNCTSLRKIVFPKSLEKMEMSVFTFCKELKYVVIKNPNIEMKDYIFDSTNPNVILVGKKDSNVSRYAKDNNIKFEDIDTTDYLNKD